jgi:hypothetical protein
VKTERCVGHVRGPIQWSETITAWSSGIGVDDVFICGTPRRDFDVPENRLLVWLLKRLVQAGRRTTSDAASWFDPSEIERVRDQGRAAQKLLNHPSLRTVAVRKPDGRELRLIRKSRHLTTYNAVLKLSERVATPFTGTDALALSSDATIEHHRVMMLLLDAVRRHGHAVPLLTVRGDFIASGQVRYRNPFIMVDRRLSAESGLYFGPHRIMSGADDAMPAGAVRIETAADAAQLVAEVLGSRPLLAARDPLAARDLLAPRAPTGDDQSASGLVQLPGSYSS